jgi:Domain of unknown function (DUF5666)
MKKALSLLLALVVSTTVTMAQEASPANRGGSKPKASNAQAFRWHGIIQRHNQEKSTLDVAREGVVRVVAYNDSTQWVNHGKAADEKDFTDGADVIVFGSLDKDGHIVARRIDLRRK